MAEADAGMSDKAAHLRSQAKSCRRLAHSVLRDEDHKLLTRVAMEFDEAADAIEKKQTKRPLSAQSRH